MSAFNKNTIISGLGWTTVSTIANGLAQILRLTILSRVTVPAAPSRRERRRFIPSRKNGKDEKETGSSPGQKTWRKSAFADVALADSTSNGADVRSGIELSYPNGVRVMIPQGMLAAEELMVYVKAYGE